MDITSLTLTELRRRLLQDPNPPSRRVLKALRNDPRAGARELHDLLTRRRRQARREDARFESLFDHERRCWADGARRVAGVDEAGMGPLAGPVVAAAVVFDPAVRIRGVDDSKVLDAPTREQLSLQIREQALGIGVGIAGVEEINRLNVYHAGLLAMRRALIALPAPPEAVLVDARTVPGISVPQHALPGGDGLSFTIACASIIAKTHRDGLMVALDEEHPGYGFAEHKGYGTPAHREALTRLGPCAAHRSSWAFLRDVCGEFDGDYYALKELIGTAMDEAALELAADCVDAARRHLPADQYRRLRQLLARRRLRLKLT